MRLIFEQQYYDAIRTYVPEDAKRVLDEQVPVIRQKVAEEIDAFVDALSADIKKTLETSAQEQADALAALRAELTAEIGKIASRPDAALKDSAKALTDAVNAYETKFKNLGLAARTAVSAVAKSYGLPISFP